MRHRRIPKIEDHTGRSVGLEDSRTHPGTAFAAILPPLDVRRSPSAEDLTAAWRAWFVAGIPPSCLPCWLADHGERCEHEVEWA